MKALILFRSYYGNTRQVAEEMAGKIRSMGHDADVRDVRARLPDLHDVDVVMAGAPTRMGRVAGSARKVMKKLKKKGFVKKLVAVFDTCGIIPKTPEDRKLMRFFEPGAAGILQKTAREQGLNLYPETLRCEVSGMRGPLTPDSLMKAAAFASGIVYYVGKRAPL
jgi:flavodoxin